MAIHHEAGSVSIKPRARPAHRRRVAKGLRAPLGIFQYLLMRAVQALHDKAYGPEIEDYLTYDIGLSVDLAQVYVTAKRLVELGYLSPQVVDHPEGAARPVKIYRVTDQGGAAVAATAQLLAEVAKLSRKGTQHATQDAAAEAAEATNGLRTGSRASRYR